MMSLLHDLEFAFATNSTVNGNPDPEPRWHPKITMHRFLVLSTTIGLGTAKAIAAYEQKSYISTTLEWISGVAIFLVLSSNIFLSHHQPNLNSLSRIFFLESREGKLEPTQENWLGWILDYDALELLWSIFKSLGLQCPIYISDEKREDIPSLNSLEHHPPITGFRILTSSTVILFGTTKAYLSYRGSSNAATAMDWISGVVISSSLYCLGLYENNTIDKMPYLFSINYDKVVFSWGWFCFQITLYVMGMAIGIVWSLGCHHFLVMYSESPIDFRTAYDGTKSEGPPSFLGHIHDMSMKYMLEGVLWLALLMGPALFLQSLWEISSLLGKLGRIRRIARDFRRFTLALSESIHQILPRLSSIAPTWAEGPLTQILPTYQFIRRFGIHIAVFASATAICAVPTFFFLGFPLRIFFQTQTKAEFITNLIVGIIYIFITGAIGGACCFAMLFSFYCLVYPFTMDWRSPEYARTILEF